MADDKFGIKIEVDSSKAIKELDNLDAKAQKVNKKLDEKHELKLSGDNAVKNVKNLSDGVDKLDKNLEKSDKKLDTVFSAGRLGMIVAGIGAVAVAGKLMYDAISGSANEIMSLSNNARGLSMPTNGLKAWQNTFKEMGFDAEEATSSLSGLQKLIFTQKSTPSPQISSAFNQLGIGDIKDLTTDQLQLKLIKAYKGAKDLTTAQMLGGQLGQSPSMVAMMRNTNFTDKLQTNLKTQQVTPEQELQARELVESQQKLTQSITLLKNEVFTPLINVVTKLVDILTLSVKGWGMITDISKKGISSVANSTQKGGYIAQHFPSVAKAINSVGSFISGNSVLSKATPEQLAKAQHLVENRKNEPVGYAMKKDAQGKYQYKLDAQGNKIPEAYGKYQIKPSTASEVLGRHVTGEDLKNDKTNEEARNKLLANWTKKYGSMEKALAYYNGGDRGLKQYEATGSTDYLNKIANVIQSDNQGNTQLASQSTAVNNAVSSNTNTVDNSMTVNGGMTVQANNPQEFANKMRNNAGYLDRFNNLTGQYA